MYVCMTKLSNKQADSMGTAQAFEPQSQCPSLILHTMFKKKKHI